MKLDKATMRIEKRRPIFSMKGWKIKGPAIAKKAGSELKSVASRLLKLKSLIKSSIVSAGKVNVNPKIAEHDIIAATVLYKNIPVGWLLILCNFFILRLIVCWETQVSFKKVRWKSRKVEMISNAPHEDMMIIEWNNYINHGKQLLVSVSKFKIVYFPSSELW